jgi:hypothetical protein
MARPDNFFVLALFDVSIVLLMYIGCTACRAWAIRIILRGHYLAAKILVPPLLGFFLLMLFAILSVAFTNFYDHFFGYQLQPDEVDGPLGNSSSLNLVLVWLYGILMILGYFLSFAPLLFRSKATK